MAYYTPGTPATANTLARAENIAAELVTIEAAFDKIPEQVSLEQDRAAYALDTGVADAYLVAMPGTWTAYTEGSSLRMKAVNGNTGASTINVDGLGVKSIKRTNGDALSAGDIPAGAVLEYYYDGTNFQIPTGAIVGTVAVASGGTGATSAGDARTNLGVVIGTDVQANDAVLDDLAALGVVANNEVIVGTGAGTYAHESGATLRTSLGVQADLNVPSQAEAEAGTATFERVWTAQRVKQAIVALESGGLASVVEDTTPQLGGDLDLNGKNIDFPTTANISDCLDEDTMASDSATMLATQQSIKAYVDSRKSLETEQASTSGTEIDFTGLTGAKRITVMFVGVSTDGTSIPQIQLGDAGGFETTGYNGSVHTFQGGGVASSAHGTGFELRASWSGTMILYGSVTLTLEDSSDNTWDFSGTPCNTDIPGNSLVAGNKALSATLTQVRITMVNGTDAFDAGAINIMVET